MTNDIRITATRTLGRRRAVLALAAAAATVRSSITLAGANSHKDRKNNRKNRKNRNQRQKIEKQSLALCAAQVAECESSVGSNSAGLLCCQKLASCDFGGFISCLEAL